MGYTHDTHMSMIIPVQYWQPAGTNTLTWSVTSNLVSAARTANTTAFSLFIPIKLLSNDSGLKGSRLKSIDVYFKNATADLTTFAIPVLQKMTLKADTVAPTGAAVTTTSTPANANTLTAAQHKVTVTLTTPEWMDDDAYYVLDLEIDPTATAVVTFYAARANFDLRV